MAQSLTTQLVDHTLNNLTPPPPTPFPLLIFPMTAVFALFQASVNASTGVWFHKDQNRQL